MENKQLFPQSEEAHIVFGDYGGKGKYGIWLLCKGKKYVLYPRQLIKMLLHKSGELTASCKDGEAWNGNTVYYYDVVDEYRWILTDYFDKRAAYLLFPKEVMHGAIRKTFTLLYDALSRNCETIYQGHVCTDTMKIFMKELELAFFISKNNYQRLDTVAMNVQKLTFYCVYDELDLTYTLALGEGSLTSYISDWTTDLTQLRKDLEMGKTIRLYFEDSPTTISFPNSPDEDVPCSKEKEVMEITANEFCNGIVLFGICYRSQVIQAIYEGLLSMARFEFKCEDGEGPWNDLDNMTFYNKLKSPLIERIIKCEWIDNEEVEIRQVIIRHIITISPHPNYVYKDEKNHCGNFFKAGNVVVDFNDTGKIVADIPGFEQWYSLFVSYIDSKNCSNNNDFDYDKWEEEGLQYVKQLRNQLPDSIDIWYEPYAANSSNHNEWAKLVYKEYEGDGSKM